MAGKLDKIHCKVMAMHQESKARQEHFTRQRMIYDYVTEWRVGLELEQVLRLFEEPKEPAQAERAEEQTDRVRRARRYLQQARNSIRKGGDPANESVRELYQWNAIDQLIEATGVLTGALAEEMEDEPGEARTD